MVASWMLFTIWKLASAVHNVYDAYEEYYKYLVDMPFDQYSPQSLKKGDWVSRSMEGGFANTGPLIYTQHHGVVIDVEEIHDSGTVPGTIKEIVHILHFQDNKIKKSTLSEYMNGEKILNVYKNNPLVSFDSYDIWDGHYNLITRNCEHFASLLIEGVAQSRQIEVLEHLAWGALWKKPTQEVMDSLKLVPRARFYV